MPGVTYQRLEEVLESLGFRFRGIQEQNKIFLHEAAGALVVYPEFPSRDEALPRHLVAIRGTLDAYGIADPLDFAARLQKAG